MPFSYSSPQTISISNYLILVVTKAKLRELLAGFGSVAETMTLALGLGRAM